jgi:large conductance mechanosensitive channel
MLGYGQFMTAVVNFLILAFVIYQLVRVTRFTRAPEAEVPTPSDELLVLR